VTTAPATTTRGALVGIATVVVERAVALVVVLVLARTLAPETFGRYGYLLAGMTLVQVMADQGVEAAVAAMASSPGAIREVFGAVLLRGSSAVVAVPVGALVLPAGRRRMARARARRAAASLSSSSACGLRARHAAGARAMTAMGSSRPPTRSSAGRVLAAAHAGRARDAVRVRRSRASRDGGGLPRPERPRWAAAARDASPALRRPSGATRS
jgi:hypothetical protein